jgi:trehalose 6-phosphate phosphatase
VASRLNGRRIAAFAGPLSGWAFFLDIDGTLLDFAVTPGRVAVDAGLRPILRRLRAATGGAVALVSGRSIAQVDRLFGSLILPTAGQHGLERRNHSGIVRYCEQAPPALATIKKRIAPLARRHGGLYIEEKGLTLAIHYRLAPQLAGPLHRLLPRLVASHGDLQLQKGKMVLEVKPAGADKGTAIADFMAELPFRGRTPVFIGDDATDEAGFLAVNSLGGYSIKVGPGATAAHWRFPDVGHVREWLHSLRPEEERRNVRSAGFAGR